MNTTESTTAGARTLTNCEECGAGLENNRPTHYPNCSKQEGGMIPVTEHEHEELERFGQPEFLVRTGMHNRNRICQQSTLSANFPEINRPSKRQPLRGIAVCVEGTGRYKKSRVHILATSSYREIVQLEAEDVKAKVRRLRPDEAKRLAEIDATIAMLKEAMSHAQSKREEVLKLAFQKGHVVYVNELRESAEAALQRRTGVQS